MVPATIAASNRCRIDLYRGRKDMALRAGSMVIAITAVALAATAPIVRAQISTPPPSETSPGAPDSDLPLADFQAFDKFAVAHPKIVSDLSHNPQLVEDQAYLAKHPEL